MMWLGGRDFKTDNPSQQGFAREGNIRRVQNLYPTKRLECWGKLEELRRRLVRDTFTAKERGELVVLGGPGPLSFATLMWRGSMYLPEVKDFYGEALEEVRHRAQEGIAALATGRCRLFHEGPVPWYPTNVMRYFHRFGAVCLGSWLYFTEFGGLFNVTGDGSWQVCPLPEEMGLPLNTRGDILHSMAVVFTRHYHRPKLSDRTDHRVKMVQHFKVDGAVFALDRGFLGNLCGAMESIVALKEAGLPVSSYQTACANPSELDQGEIVSRIDSFMESLGLEALESGRPLLEAEASGQAE